MKTKIIITLVLIVALTFFAAFGLIFALFSGSSFYSILILLVYPILFMLIPMTLFYPYNRKVARITWIFLLVAITASCAIYEGKNAYDKSVLRIRESGVDLNLYTPFQNDGRVASLNSASTLKLETDLPRLDGATALYPVYSAFAQAVYPEKRDGQAVGYDLFDSEVACNNTIGAYERLIAGIADIIFVAPPSEYQLEEAENNGVEFELTPIGKEAFVFFVNAKNPVNNLTVDELRGIYSGEITKWKQVGGKNESIRAFQRNENSGSQTAFRHFMEGYSIMRPPLNDVVGGMGPIIDRTADYANYQNAIGFSFRFYANQMVGNNDVKLLSINGVYPDVQSIKSEMYPLSSFFYAVTLKGNEKPNVQLLLDWILSEQGQYLIEKTGYNPIPSY